MHFKEIVIPPPPTEQRMTLNIQQITTPPPAPKPKSIPVPKKVAQLPKPIVKPIVKPIIKKEIKPEKEKIKKKILDKSKKVFAHKSTEENNVSKATPKPKKKIIKKKVVKKKPIKKKPVKNKKKKIVKKPKRQSNTSLYDNLMNFGSSSNTRKSKKNYGSGNYGEKEIKRLYGSAFNSYTNTQKKYIRHNLNIIQQITQRTLYRNGYPRVAVRTQQQGTNIVSFYLHPNGDISGLKLKHRIGYASLDKNTLKVIRLAYSGYPLPNQKTRIIFHVRYSLY